MNISVIILFLRLAYMGFSGHSGPGSRVPVPGPGSRVPSSGISSNPGHIKFNRDSEFAPQIWPLIYYNIINNCNRITQNLLLKNLINSFPSKIWLQKRPGPDFVT